MKNSTSSTLKKYLKEVRRHWLSGLVIVITVIGGAATGTIIPLYVRDIFNILVGSAPNKLPLLFAVLISYSILQATGWVLWRIATFFSSYFQTGIMTDLSAVCFKHLHKHSFAFFNNNFVGSLVKRVNYFVRAFEAIADVVTWNILPLIVNMVIIMTVLFRTNRFIGFIMIGWLIVFSFVNGIFTWYKMKYDLERSDAETKATGLLADTITNNANVKLFVGYDREVKRFFDANELVRRLRLFTWNLDSWFEAVQGFLMVGLDIGIFYFGVKLAVAGRLTIGDFVLLQTYLIMIFDQVWGFGKLVRNVYTNLADANDMTIMLDTPHEIQDAQNAKALTITKGEIVFKNVDFYYHETRKIFSKLNLIIASHEKVALVGPSGAGKSTIVKLLLRMHDISAGSIAIDGQRINRVTQESLWQAVSLVPQDPILFHRTLMENIRYGRPEATDEEVLKASELAHCDEFISEFPEKYKTYVGERGIKLSGGERQRVAIARAILRDAPILVLDEATSSLDSESEALIQDALKNLMRNKTVIVIAHRLSTIMTMDRIVVVDHGAVVEEGTHTELLKKKKGIYQGLWKIQAGGFLADKKSIENAEAGLDERQAKDYDDESSED